METSAIHTAYPEYLRESIERRILSNNSPFESPILKVAKGQDKEAIVNGEPSVIIARTTKGRGVKMFEYDNRWHGMAPNKDQYEAAKRELEEGLKAWQS